MTVGLVACVLVAAQAGGVVPARPEASAVADPLASYRNISLWDAGQVPLATGTGPLDRPFLTVFAPRAGSRNGASVIIAPGGSNIMLMYGAEGIDIAERYNDWGATAFVLTYRMAPAYGTMPG